MYAKYAEPLFVRSEIHTKCRSMASEYSNSAYEMHSFSE